MPPKPHFFQIKVRGDVPDVKERVAMVAIGKFVYIMGGYSRLNDAYYNTVHIFDSESLTFQNVPLQGEFPSARCTFFSFLFSSNFNFYFIFILFL